MINRKIRKSSESRDKRGKNKEDIKCVKAELLYTGYDKAPLRDVYLVFNDMIISISKKKPDYELINKFEVVTPAFIDAHSHIGMERAGEPYDNDDVNEHMESILTLTDALDSVQMDDSAFKNSIESGILYSCVLPGSGNIIGGRTAIIKNYAKNTSDALIGRAGIKAAFGWNPKSTTDWKGTRPNTRMGSLAILRKAFMTVQNKLHKQDKKIKKTNRKRKRKDSKNDNKDELSPNEKVIADLLKGKEFLRTHVHKSDDIYSLLRITDEFKIRTTVEHACNVHDIDTFIALKIRGINVIYGPMDSFPYKVELRDENWKNIKYLLDSKVNFGLMSDHPVIMQNTLPLTLRWFLRAGMPKEAALSILTYQNAKILGIDKFLGTLDKNKWASFIGWNGDPFNLENYPIAVYGEGKQLY